MRDARRAPTTDFETNAYQEFHRRDSIIREGGDPIGVAFDPDDAVVEVQAGNFLLEGVPSQP